MPQIKFKKFVLTLAFVAEVLASGLTASFARAEEAPDCLLHMDKRDTVLSRALEKRFGGRSGIRFVPEAVPMDILDCVRNGARRITVVAHSADMDTAGQKTAPLVYMRKIVDEERKATLQSYHDWLTREIELAEQELSQIPLWQSSEDTIPVQSRAASELQSRIARLKENLDYFDHLSDDEPLYDDPRFVLNRIWQKLIQYPGALERLSLVCCLPEMVELAYPEFGTLRKMGVEIQFSPVNRVMAFLSGKRLVSPSLDWIEESFAR